MNSQKCRKAVGLLACAAVFGTFSTIGSAAVTIIENQSGDSWPGTDPEIDVAGGNVPSFFSTGVGIPDGSSASQTFTVVDAFTLGRLDVAYSTAASSTVGLRLVEVVDEQLNEAETAYVYSAGATLIDTTFTFLVDTTDVQVMTFNFTGDDQVALAAGQSYAFEFYDIGTVEPNFSLRRRGGSYYAAGRVYTDRVSVNGTSTRDAGMQIFAVPEPGSLALLGLGGVLMLGRRRAV